ncbi:MAG: hypothetical protein HY314_03120, partial [Acidobacteria bacterium]|nr:hypothetical protein [Acidobacteriota bacterium]
ISPEKTGEPKIINESLGYAPSGVRKFASRPYAYKMDPPIHEDLFGDCFIAFMTSVPISVVTLMVTVMVCHSGFLDVESLIRKNLEINIALTPGLTLAIPIKARITAANIVGASIILTPSGTLQLSVSCDVTPGPSCEFLEPCLRFHLGICYEIDIFLYPLEKGCLDPIELARFGCSDSATELTNPAASAAPDVAVAALRPSPSVASDGNGHALAVWVQEESRDPSAPSRRLHFSYRDDATWTTPARVSDSEAPVDSPKVAFLGPNRALAVWVQSKLSLAQGFASDAATVLRSAELYYSQWNGQRWSQPAPMTNDQALDARPSLAADPTTEQAMLVWLRADNPTGYNQLADGIYYATFNGQQWSAPALIAPRT